MSLLLIVISGFLLALIAPGMYRVAGERSAYLITLLPAAIVGYLAFHLGSLGGDEAIRRYQLDWIPEIGLRLSLTLDGLSYFFALLIAGIGVLVCFYTRAYLAGHEHFGLFYSYLLVFMASMLGVVLASNILSLYLFWELTTVSSFLLIGFEHQKESARAAALQSLLTTALGGLSMLAGFVLLGIVGGSFEIPELISRAASIREHRLYPAIVVLIALGAFAKSAQFPFHYWLPNAMEAPTPVSAYLHSATMVKAGVYLLARLLPVLGGTSLWSGLLGTIGAVTMVLGAWLAYFEHDLKRVLAYLTINVLGTLVMLLGIGTALAVKAAVVYLAAHAFYKGALFLMAGIVDHETGRRDIRQLRGLWRPMPITAAIAILAALSMAGFIPLFGFIAKESLMEALWADGPAGGALVVATVASSSLLVAGAGLVGLQPFWGRTSEPGDLHRASVRLWLSPAVLAGAGLLVGLLPQRLAQPVLEPAAAVVSGEVESLDLALWHGFTPALVLSVTAILMGLMLYAVRGRLLYAADRAARLRISADDVYDGIVAAINKLAVWQTAVLQSGHLRRYTLTIVAVLVVLVAPLLPGLEWQVRDSRDVGIRFHEALVSLLIVVAAVVVIRSESRFRAIAALGIIGFSVAWLFNAFGAPDLAMTQLVVESLTVLLFVFAFYHLAPFTQLSSRAVHVRDFLVALAAGVTVGLLLLLVSNMPHETPISEFYGQASYLQAHGRNVVNVILVDFRAFDTLGEGTVLATAAIGVLAVIKLLRTRKDSAGGSE